MKKIAITLLAVILLSFGIAEEKSLSVKATLVEWQKHITKLETIRAVVDESNLPNQQVKFITRTIDSLELLIIPQLNKELTDTTKKKK